MEPPKAPQLAQLLTHYTHQMSNALSRMFREGKLPDFLEKEVPIQPVLELTRYYFKDLNAHRESLLPELAALDRSVRKNYDSDTPEKREFLSRMAHLLGILIYREEDKSEETPPQSMPAEQLLEEVARGVPQDCFTFDRDSQGKLLNPAKQLEKLKALLNSRTDILPLLNPKKNVHTVAEYVNASTASVNLDFKSCFGEVFSWEGRTIQTVEQARADLKTLHYGAGFRAKVQINIPPELGQLTRLRWLSFDPPTSLCRIPRALTQLPKLESFSLFNTKFTSFPEEIYHFPALTKLFLEGVMPNFARLTQLQELGIGNSLRRQPTITVPADAFERLSQLQRLFLSNCAIPASIGALTTLKKLEINYCEAEVLPQELGALTQLTELICMDSQFKTLPASIGNLVNLEEILLARTDVVQFPSEIGKLVKLKRLKILSTTISTSLPDELGDLPQLQEIECRKEVLPYLPQTLVNCPNLERITVRNGFSTDDTYSWNKASGIPLAQFLKYIEPAPMQT